VNKKNTITFFLVLVLILIFWSSFALQEKFSGAVEGLKKYVEGHQVLGIFIFISLAVVSVILGPVTSAPLIPPALIIWGKSATFIFLLAGWMIGAGLTYLIGRNFGYPLVKIFVSSEKFIGWIHDIADKMEFWLVLLFRFATPAETGYVFGILRYNFKKYFLVTLLAEIPTGLMLIFASEAILEKEKTIFLAFAAGSILAISFMYYLFKRRLKHLANRNRWEAAK